MSDTSSSALTITEVAEDNRIDFLPKLFGPWYLSGEQAVFSFMSELCQDYGGGYWDFFEVSNGARFLAPSRTEACPMVCDGNGFAGTMSPQAAGIVVTLFALSHLSFASGAPFELSISFQRLYEYATTHPETEVIFQAID